jgi:hypothetical protein
MEVVPARLYRTDVNEGEAFVPLGESLARPRDIDYREEEWFASGTDDGGRPYLTQVYCRVPADPARFSGTVIVEPLHASGVGGLFMSTSPYVLRSGHAWICVASQKSSLDAYMKGSQESALHGPPKAHKPKRYEELEIHSDVPLPAVSLPGQERRDRTDSEEPAEMPNPGELMVQLMRYNHASDAILAQVGLALSQAAAPLEGLDVQSVILAGHSQTGHVTSSYIVNSHEPRRRPDGTSIFDGYFPAGNPTHRFGPRDVPVVQIMSDGDIATTMRWGTSELRPHRRPDSDDPDDRYRLYEIAGIAHVGTRYPPMNNAQFWDSIGDPAHTVLPGSTMNSLPHDALFSVCLDHLVQWVAKGVTPPRAERIEVAPDGFFAKDEFGNPKGGVRCVQLEVPRAAYYSSPPGPAGHQTFGLVGIEVPFDKATLNKLYTGKDDYLEKYNRRLDELLAERWLLPEDANEMRNEAIKADIPTSD